MNRRAFIRLLGVGAAGLAVAPLLPVAAPAVVAPALSTSQRFIQHYDVSTDLMVSRMDVLYGYGTLHPNYGIRVVSA